MKSQTPIVVAVMLTCRLLAAAQEVDVGVEGKSMRQVYEGFGATTLSLVHTGQLGDTLGPHFGPQVLDALYGQVKLNMGNLAIGLLESPGGWDHRSNDNDDPTVINWKGFDTFQADSMWNYVVKPSAALGLDNYSLEGKINWNWASPWLRELYRTDRERCLDECAEQVEASVTYWRKIAGSVPRYVHLFNEPTSGNCEIAGADAEMVRDIVKRAGDRLRAAGFQELKFVVPNEETVERSTGGRGGDSGRRRCASTLPPWDTMSTPMVRRMPRCRGSSGLPAAASPTRPPWNSAAAFAICAGNTACPSG